jgi:GNAT superfamily N-acetyltransferase
MRAEEFVQEKINPEVIDPGFKIERQLSNGFVIQASAEEPHYDDPSPSMRDLRGVTIRVFDPASTNWVQKEYGIGKVTFLARQNKQTGEWDLRPVSVAVDNEYQRQGIASAMYNFARKLGNDVIPSSIQTDMGKAFWKGGAGQGRDLEVTDLPEPKPELKPEPKPEPKSEPEKPASWMQRFKNILTPEPAYVAVSTK